MIRINKNGGLGRATYSDMAGLSFDTKRDTYKEAGYPRDLTTEHYWSKYARQDVVRRICSVFADDTWRNPPDVMDGGDLENARKDTEFVSAWNNLVNPPPDFTRFRGQRSTVYSAIRRADRLSALGQYSILLLGISDGSSSLADELLPGQGRNLIYMTPYSEKRVRLDSTMLIDDPFDEGFGMPARYEVQVSDGAVHVEVHPSRVIHIAERLDSSDVFGAPLLEGIYNRLDDLDQVLAASKEAFWKMIDQGWIFTEAPEHVRSSDIDVEDIRNFIDGLTRTLELRGWEVERLGSQAVDPSGIIDVIFTVIAASLGMPKRILTGSERGELSSSQDEKSWNDVIRGRMVEFAEPVLRSLIDRLVYAGVLPVPSFGTYIIQWPSLYETSDAEKADLSLKYAQFVKELSTPGVESIVRIDEFIKGVARDIPTESLVDPMSIELDLIREDLETDSADNESEQ